MLSIKYVLKVILKKLLVIILLLFFSLPKKFQPWVIVNRYSSCSMGPEI